MIRFHICQNIRGPHRHRGQHLRAKTAVSRGWHQSPPPRPSAKGHTTAEICIIVSRTVNSSTAESRTVEIRTVEIHCVIVLTNQSGPLGTRRPSLCSQRRSVHRRSVRERAAPQALERPAAAPAGSSGPAHKPGRGRRPGMTSWQVGALLQWFSGSSGGRLPPLPAATGAEQTPALLTAPSPSLVRRGRLPGLPSPLLRRQVPRSPPLLALVQRAACRPCCSAHHIDVEAAVSAH